MGAQSIPMPNGQLTMPFLSAGGIAEYVGENSNATKQEQTFGQLVMTAKKLAVVTPVSNDLLNDSSPSADMIVRNDLVRNAAVREDLAFIRDDGTGNKPRGMRHWAVSGNVFATAGTTAAQVAVDLAESVLKLEEGNIPMTRPGWIMSPRSKSYLFRLLDSNSNSIYRDELAQGTLLGFPIMTSTQIPNNLGGGTESEVYFADFAHLLIGETESVEITAIDGAAYHDGSAVQSAFSQDQTVMRLIARHDFGARYRGNEIAVVTGVTWGA
jgi:HK97 family phage major capsid protein